MGDQQAQGKNQEVGSARSRTRRAGWDQILRKEQSPRGPRWSRRCEDNLNAGWLPTKPHGVFSRGILPIAPQTDGIRGQTGKWECQ